MNRKLLPICLLAVLLLAGFTRADAPPDFCVRVFVTDRGGEHSMGSGTLLSPTLIVTNWHVVKDADRRYPVKILFPSWKVVAGRIVKADRRWDIAAIIIPKVDVTPAKIGAKPEKGDDLTVHGYGMGLPATDTGKLTQFNMPDKHSPADLITIKPCKVRNGDSGGPILNAAGEYVGTLFGGNATTKETMGTHVGRVLEVLGSLLKQGDWYNDYDLTSHSP